MSDKSLKVSNPYRDVRESRHLTREQASELTTYMSPSKIEHIERGITEPRPDEVLCLARCYECPELICYYCDQVCDIGRQLFPINLYKSISEIILHVISTDEQFESIRADLLRISSTNNDIPVEDPHELFMKLHSILKDAISCEASLGVWIDSYQAEAKRKGILIK